MVIPDAWLCALFAAVARRETLSNRVLFADADADAIYDNDDDDNGQP